MGFRLKKHENKRVVGTGKASPKRASEVKRKASGKPAPPPTQPAPVRGQGGSSAPAREADSTKKPTLRSRVVEQPNPSRPLNRTARTKAESDNGALRRPARQAPPPLAVAPDPEEPPRKVETYLNDKQLAEFRELLLEKRHLLTGDVERLADQARDRKEHGFNEQSTMPIHMADLGSDTWEQDFTLELLASEQGVVREIDEALRRIDDRTYGICLATDARITVARLRAKPWARYCIEYARAREEGRVP